MNFEQNTIVVIVLSIITVVALAIFFLGKKIKSAEIVTGVATAKISTHKPDQKSVEKIEQNSTDGSNKLNVHSTDISVADVKQTAKHSNTIEIGNR